MTKFCCFILLLILHQQPCLAQANPVNSKLFFLDDNVVEVTLTTDIKKLRSTKNTSPYQPADIVMKFSDTSVISEQISVQTRGKFRKSYCDLSSLRLNFKTPTSPKLSKLKKLKLVGGCGSGKHDEELLLKEYLVYKMYNQLSIMSFKVRLLHVTYNDSKQKMKPYTQYAFLMEDMGDVAERNNCIERKTQVYKTEGTHRLHMTFVSIFEYMIGNTDFSVPNHHNISLMVPKNDTLKKPYPVPYDFDYAGIVNTSYAVPREELGIASVRDRLYRGFPRTMDEIEPVIEIFKEKKEAILFTIKNFPLLRDKAKEDMDGYLQSFFKMLEKKHAVKQVFVDGARTL